MCYDTSVAFSALGFASKLAHSAGKMRVKMLDILHLNQSD